MEPSRLSLLGSGAATNESLHREINRWFSNRPEIYMTTLRLKLTIRHIGKLVAHSAALYRPTLRQLTHHTVLVQAIHAFALPVEEWIASCRTVVTGAVPRKADLPLLHERQSIALQLRQRPAAYKRPASGCVATKRTPFTLKRAGSFKRGPSLKLARRPAAGPHG
jgi:hypothetical protein